MFREELDKYNAELLQDVAIDEVHLESIVANIPNIHSKWLHKYIIKCRELDRIKCEVDKLYLSLHHGYKFGASDYKLSPNDLSKYVEGNDQYIAKMEVYDDCRQLVKFLESALKQVNGISFLVESIIKWKQLVTK